MTFKKPFEFHKNLTRTDSTQANYKRKFPETTNQWYGRQKLLPYEIGGPMVKRLPYVRERLIGCWSAD